MLKDYNPIFGKNVIETLSEGMYDNPLFLFREYVQNSADAIDAAVEAGVIEKEDGQIQIVIVPSARKIIFSDNGIGIAKRDVPSILSNIGNSQKDRFKNKGFRGIGRLGGLGYCRLVRFETSVNGESVKSVLEWDAEKLHSILMDQSEKIDAGELIKRITTIKTENAPADDHYFIVTLEDVAETSDDLLDVDDVRKYLSMVAPVPFDYQKFRFVEDIEKFINKNQLPHPNEYQIFLNGDELRKGYETPLLIEGTTKCVETLDVECRLLKDERRVFGWYWFCVSKFEGVLPKSCWQRCIRLRKSNIQIGEADCLSNHPKRGQALWKEDRGNNYFMGEIHALDERLIPNSRRDYFNQDEACREFEAVLAEQFKELHKIYHKASDARSASQTIRRVNAEIKSFNEKDRAKSFFDEKEREAALKHINEQVAKAEKAKSDLAKMADDNEKPDSPAKLVIDSYCTETPQQILSNTVKVNPAKSTFVKDSMSASVRSVLDKVFAVVDAVLPPDDAKLLRAAIMKRFERK